MPFGDGTGPLGEGPFTGRRGGGMGRGRGRGLGRGFGRGLGRGMAYGRGNKGIFLTDTAAKGSLENIDEKTKKLADEIYEVLPKINCKACGYPTCMECALAIAQGKAPYDACRVLKADGHAKIKDILNKEGR